MENFYPVYEKVENWSVIDSRTIHDFTENEHPFEAVNVKIGNLVYDDNHTSPITRWITRNEYEYFLNNAGIVIW